MAICERGYLCEVCGEEVAEIRESDLYLRYVLGEVDPETLHTQPERHLTCNPTLAQFIVADDFAPMEAQGPFAKSRLDPAFVASEEARVTRGYRRLCELPAPGVPLTEYPLPEVRSRWQDPPADPGTRSSEVAEGPVPVPDPVQGREAARVGAAPDARPGASR